MALNTKKLNKSVKLSYLVPYALLAVVAVAALATTVGWHLHGNYNQDIDQKVEARLTVSKE